MLNKIYDFKIGDGLLVEYDGEYWHANRSEKDAEKDDIAVNNGYQLLRVSDKHDRDIDILIKIKGILNEIQSSKNK